MKKKNSNQNSIINTHAPQEPDAYCFTREDGECISVDPRCMHMPRQPTPEQPKPALLTNPYTGQPRDYRDVESDPDGILIHKPGEPLHAPEQPKPAPMNVMNELRELAAVMRLNSTVRSGFHTNDELENAATLSDFALRLEKIIASATEQPKPMDDDLFFDALDEAFKRYPHAHDALTFFACAVRGPRKPSDQDIEWAKSILSQKSI